MGFKTATIDVDETETNNIRLYKKMGFIEKVKDSVIDPCNVDENQMPKTCDERWLLQKTYRYRTKYFTIRQIPML